MTSAGTQRAAPGPAGLRIAGSGRSRTSPGFTLIEVLAALFLMSIVIAIAVGFYINLSNASARATTEVRRLLRATTALDRITRDFESVILLTKPAEVDPLSHPWFFTASNEYAEEGADRVKFITGSQRPSAFQIHSSDVAQMAYFLVRSAEGEGGDYGLDSADETFDLYRWSSPGLPSQVDLDFPDAEDPRSFLLVDGLRSFSLRFRDEAGEWVEEWDSTQLVESSELPTAIEIRLAFGDPESEEDADAWELAEEANTYSRRIALTARPIDLESLILASLDLEGGGEEGDLEDDALEAAGFDPNTPVSEVVNANWARCVETLGEETCRRLQSDQKALSEFEGMIPEDLLR